MMNADDPIDPIDARPVGAGDDAARRAQQVLLGLPDTVFALDAEGRFALVSPAWRTLTDLSVEDTVGQRLLESVDADDRDDVRVHLEGLYAGLLVSWRASFRIVTPSRDSLWVEVHAAPVAGRSGDVSGVLGIMRDVSVAKRRELDLAQRALLDPVIGIPNRVLLLDRLQRRLARAERRSEPPFAVVLMDLDDFKSINDELGHLAGDEALKVVASRLVSAVREADTVARFGGDEFVVLLDEVSGGHGARALTRRMRDLLMQPVSLGGRSVHLSASFGMFVMDPSLPRRFEVREVLACADQAMYRAKRNGSGIAQYTPVAATPRLGYGAADGVEPAHAELWARGAMVCAGAMLSDPCS